MNNMTQRILAGAVGIPAAIFLMWMGGWYFSIAIIVITTLALREFYTLASNKDASPNVALGLSWSILIQVFLAMATQTPGRAGFVWMGLATLTFIGGIVAVYGTELWRNREHALLNTALTIAGVAYVTLSLSMLMVLHNTNWPGVEGSFGDGGASLVLTIFVSIWACDSAAYFGGTWFGRHKLFPRVSPKKSWEGAAAGLIGAVAAFVGLGLYLMPSFDPVQAVALGIIVGVFGQIGDLAESLLKRDAAIKDSSGVIPGHGGVLDRFDSMLFAAPLILIYLSLVDLLVGLGG